MGDPRVAPTDLGLGGRPGGSPLQTWDLAGDPVARPYTCDAVGDPVARPYRLVTRWATQGSPLQSSLAGELRHFPNAVAHIYHAVLDDMGIDAAAALARAFVGRGPLARVPPEAAGEFRAAGVRQR